MSSRAAESLRICHFVDAHPILPRRDSSPKCVNMNARQMDLPSIAAMPDSSERSDIARILLKARLRHKGDIRAYYAKAFDRTPRRVESTLGELTEVAKQRRETARK